MELRHLRYFIAVAEELHFGRAAKRLNMSQPPLSQQIKQLELIVGFKLFHRSNKSVHLTEAGKELYQRSIRILREINIAVNDAKNTSRGVRGVINLSFSGSAAFDMLPSILKVSSKHFPDISLKLTQLTTHEQVILLEEKKIDIGLIVPPANNLIIETEIFKIEELIICMPENHRLAKGPEKVDINDLKEENFIMSPRESGIGYYESIYKVFEDAGFDPIISQTAKEQLTMVSLVASGLGIAIVPKSIEAIKIKGITYKKLLKKYEKVNSIAWNKENNRPIVSEFISFLRQNIIPNFNKV